MPIDPRAFRTNPRDRKVLRDLKAAGEALRHDGGQYRGRGFLVVGFADDIDRLEAKSLVDKEQVGGSVFVRVSSLGEAFLGQLDAASDKS